MEEHDIDIVDEVQQILQREIKFFRERCFTVPSIERYFEIEIEKYNNCRHGEPDYIAFFDNDISLRGYYISGWDSAERGGGTQMPKTLYWWDKEVLTKVQEKYSKNKLLKDYYPRLNKVAQEEYVIGVADAWHYHWLKNEFVKWRENSENSNDVKSIGIPLLQWNLPINIIITFFYDLLNKQAITWNGRKGEGAKAQIARMISTNFVDNKGKEISEEYILQILKPNTVKARNRIDIFAITSLLKTRMKKKIKS